MGLLCVLSTVLLNGEAADFTFEFSGLSSCAYLERREHLNGLPKHRTSMPPYEETAAPSRPGFQ
jgi:hypothetical protein